MSAEKNDGGSAFPGMVEELVPDMADPDTGETISWRSKTKKNPGMDLRDWFAGQAMASLIIVNEGCFSSLGVGAAKDAYAAADAMLKARDAPLN